jgi:hypothetical protein
MEKTHTEPRIIPKTWDDAIGIIAGKIDYKRALGVQHPMIGDYELQIPVIRMAYDNFAGQYYGAEPPEHVAADWFTAMGIIALDTAGTFGYEMETAESLLPLLRSKMDDYGYENIARFGLDGILVRMHDKIARLENLVGKKGPRNESVADTLADLIGYSMIGWLDTMGLWTLPLKGSDLLN